MKNLDKILPHLFFWSLIIILTIGLIHSIIYFQTPEQYAIEYQRLQDLCDARTPEGYICLLDYYPQPPFFIATLTALILLSISYILYIFPFFNRSKNL